MKFSNSLKFNAVAEWWDEYIAYSTLKKHIYQLEKKRLDSHDGVIPDLESDERTALMPGASAADAAFVPLLDRELKKIRIFYEIQEKELLDEIRELDELVLAKEGENFSAADNYMLPYEDDEDDDEAEASTGHKGHDRSSNLSSTRGTLPGHRRPSISGKHRDDPHSSSRRYSVSSSEDNMDLEASLASLNQIPEDEALSPSRRVSKSPTKSRGTISSIFNRVLPGGSVSSTFVPETIWTAKSNYAVDTRILFKRRISNLYNSLTSLRSYVELNYSGFRKILKKYDKVTFNELKDHYLHNVVETAYPFQQSTKDGLNDAINRLVFLYSKCVTKDDHSAAVRQLKMHQREHVAWERETVWRQMINRERRGESDGEVKAISGRAETPENNVVQFPTPLGRFKLKRRHIFIAISVAIFVVLLNVPMVEGTEANNCLAVLIFSTIMWATEAIPLFVTSIMVPLLLVCLRVFRSEDDERLSAEEATKYVFQQMFSSTIMLLIGGFTIASAISKTSIDRILITKVLSFAGTRPNIVLLAVMGVSCFASMWISNVAAPTLCFTLIRPILRTLPPRSSFAPCLIIGIALAANIGGQTSPISSPQNLIALEYMDPQLDWGSWFIVSIPVSAVSILLIWLLLIASYRPSKLPDGEELEEIKPIRATKESFTLKQYWVTFVCIFTIVLWVMAQQLKSVFGDMGIIAIIPIIAFFSTGVLRKDDFEQFLWTIVFLAMGGIALGRGVTNSGLLVVMDEGIRYLVSDLSLVAVVFVMSLVVLVVSTFISHTIASVLLAPIAKTVGDNLPGNHGRLLVFLTGLICSTGMGMPVSGFPNQTAATEEDEMGQLYLSNVDFLKNGIPASIIAMLVVATLGFLLMLAIGL